MANCSRGRGRAVRTVPAQAAPLSPSSAPAEPEMRRWAHPVDGGAELPRLRPADPALHYIRCALSYQNQTLAEIKALLEQLVTDRSDKTAP